MAISDARQVIDLAGLLREQFARERRELDVLRRYVTGKQPLPLVIPRDAPAEVREMARISRINIIAIVVNALVESLFVDNIRAVDTFGEDAPQLTPEQLAASRSQPSDDAELLVQQIWNVWQRNKLDRGQSGLYRAVFTYGYSYAVTYAGDPLPIVRAVSPRKMTTMYADDPDWPVYALEKRPAPGGRKRWRLYEETHMYDLAEDDRGRLELLGEARHGLTYCPVVRYVDAEDLDEDDEPDWTPQEWTRAVQTNIVAGQVAPLMTLQDQADVTTFSLRSAEWYTAFRQRWIVGWTPENRGQKMQMGASQTWAFEDSPDDIRVGEFAETTLQGYLNSRDATARFAATLSQTPVHELIGELVNLSAEALAAAEAGRDRKVDLRKTSCGESHEQLAGAIGDLIGVDVPDDIEVVWRDTSARAFGAMVDGLGKLAQMLGVPPQALWERIPGVTRQEISRWAKLAREGDALAGLTGILERQAAPPAGRTESGLILPPGVEL